MSDIEPSLEWVPSSMNPGADNTLVLVRYASEEAFVSTEKVEDQLTDLSKCLSFFYQLIPVGKFWFAAFWKKEGLAFLKHLPEKAKPFNFNWAELGTVANDQLNSHMFSAGEALYMKEFKEKCLQSKTDLDFYMDSGGFQVAVGRRIFLPPDKVIALMADVANFGIAADIPSSTENTDLLKMLARIQKMNTVVFKNHLKKYPKFGFVNVVHGFDLKSIRQYAEIVHEQGEQRWSIGSAWGNYYALLAAIILIREFKAKHIHFLGKASWKLIPAMALLSKYVKVTSDSTTHLMAGKNAEYIKLIPVEKYGVSCFFRVKLPIYVGGPFQMLDFNKCNCRCELCRLMSNSNLYRMGMGGEANRLLATHNMMALAHVFEGWGRLAMECPPNYFCKIVEEINEIDEVNRVRESWVNANFIKYALVEEMDYDQLERRYDEEMDYAPADEKDDSDSDLDIWKSVSEDNNSTLIKAMAYRYMLFSREETRGILEEAIKNGELEDVFDDSKCHLQHLLDQYYADFSIFMRSCLSKYYQRKLKRMSKAKRLKVDFSELELSAFGDKDFIKQILSFEIDFGE